MLEKKTHVGREKVHASMNVSLQLKLESKQCFFDMDYI